MADRPANRSKTSGSGNSTRDWIVDGIAWEIQTALVAIPALVVAGIVALLFDVSVTMVLVVAIVVALAVRLLFDLWRRLRSAEPAGLPSAAGLPAIRFTASSEANESTSPKGSKCHDHGELVPLSSTGRAERQGCPCPRLKSSIPIVTYRTSPRDSESVDRAPRREEIPCSARDLSCARGDLNPHALSDTST